MCSLVTDSRKWLCCLGKRAYCPFHINMRSYTLTDGKLGEVQNMQPDRGWIWNITTEFHIRFQISTVWKSNMRSTQPLNDIASEKLTTVNTFCASCLPKLNLEEKSNWTTRASEVGHYIMTPKKWRSAAPTDIFVRITYRHFVPEQLLGQWWCLAVCCFYLIHQSPIRNLSERRKWKHWHAFNLFEV